MFLGNILENLKLIYSNPIILLISITFLTIASYFDFKTRKIPDRLNLLFLIMRIGLIPLIGFNFNNLLGLVFGGLVILIPAMIMNKPMGGDIKCMAVLGFIIGIHSAFVLLITIAFTSLIYILIVNYTLKSRIEIPFAPFYLFAHLAMCILINIIL